MEELGIFPSGRTLIKPNIVAAGSLFTHAYTRPEFAEGMLLAVQDRAKVAPTPPTEIAIGERCGITIPTRMVFRESGYTKMLSRFPAIKKYFFEECSQVEIPLTHKTRLRDYVFTPEPVARADCFINMPKFKAHPWTTVTFSLKNYIGIQDDRHRLIDHDHRLNEKIADLQYIVQPTFIAIDGIIAGESRMLTPTPYDLGLIIMGNSQVAFDAVCSHIAKQDPRSVEHIRRVEDNGFGTTDISSIDITGDVTFEQAKARAKDFKIGLVRVEEYFRGTNISAYAGPPPESEYGDYCWGGCPGAIEEAIEILRVHDKDCDSKLPRLHVVFGAYQGEIPAKEGERVIFIGDCANWSGTLHDKPVQIESVYQARDTIDPHKVKNEGIYKKMMTTTKKLISTRKAPYLRLTGCPVSVAEQILALVGVSKIDNPYLAADQIVSFNRGYLSNKRRNTLNRLMGKRYQKNGSFTQRGKGAPEVAESAPPSSKQ